MNKGREPLRHCQGNRSWATPHQPRSCASVWRDGLRLVRQDQERPAANAGCYRRGRLRGAPHQGAVLRGRAKSPIGRKKGSRPMPWVTTTRHRRGTNFSANAIVWAEHRHEDRISHCDCASCFCSRCWDGGLFDEKPIRPLPTIMGSVSDRVLRSVSGVL
jgi:hypothetical protein